MNINGFQKLTLLDFPGKVAAIVFTPGCNFRCPFCHNASLVTHIDLSERISEDDVLSYLNKRKGLLDGVCITGGEPLLQNDVNDFIKKVKDMGYGVKLDTNGSNPQKLKELIDNGLVDYVAMDIKNSKEKYPLTAGCTVDVDAVSKSVELLLFDAVDYEFRTTVVHPLHTVEDIAAVAEWIKGAKRYFIQGFKDSGDLIGSGMSRLPDDTLKAMQAAAAAQNIPTFVRGMDK